MRRASILLAALAAASCLACGPSRGARCNVLLVVLDTVRADHCSFLGYARDTTPRLAALARESWTFANAWTCAPWTLPAHASLFTGVGTGRHGCGRDAAVRLPDSWTTLAERLRDAGWATGCFSANHFVDPDYGTSQGFDHEDRALHGAAHGAPAAAVNARALAFMRAQTQAGKPFFAFVNLMEAHMPRDPPEALAARFRRGARDDPAAGETAMRKLAFPESGRIALSSTPCARPWRERMEDLYDAEIASVDDAAGALVDALRADGVLDDTLVVVLSDHGEGLGDHDWLDHALGVHAEMLRIPLLVRLPGRFGGGRVVRELARIEDVHPTVLAACGLPVPEGLDGAPLEALPPGRAAFAAQDRWAQWVPTLRDGAAEDLDYTRLLVKRRSVTDGRSHLVTIVEDPAAVELYDLAADPGETTDVSGAHPEEVARLRALLDASSTR